MTKEVSTIFRQLRHRSHSYKLRDNITTTSMPLTPSGNYFTKPQSSSSPPPGIPFFGALLRYSEAPENGGSSATELGIPARYPPTKRASLACSPPRSPRASPAGRNTSRSVAAYPKCLPLRGRWRGRLADSRETFASDLPRKT